MVDMDFSESDEDEDGQGGSESDDSDDAGSEYPSLFSLPPSAGSGAGLMSAVYADDDPQSSGRTTSTRAR